MYLEHDECRQYCAILLHYCRRLLEFPLDDVGIPFIQAAFTKLYSLGYKHSMIDVAELRIDPNRLAPYSLLPKLAGSQETKTQKHKKKDERVQARESKSATGLDRQNLYSWLVSEALLRQATKKNYEKKIFARQISLRELIHHLKDQKSWSSLM